jgi:amidophosphoribosyltransferase
LVFFLQGIIEDELNFNLRNLLHEQCGLAAVINIKLASQYVYDCLVLQDHRGEKSAGIISHDGNGFKHRKRMGSVKAEFNDVNFQKMLPGTMASGHNRYATQGDPDSLTNIQPLFFNESKYGPFASAHNGTLVNSRSIRKELIEKGAIFQSTTDSEIIGHLIAMSKQPTLEKAIIDALKNVKAAYSLLIMTPDKLFAIKDKFGLRPLSVGKLGGGYLVCSETYAMDQFPDIEHIDDILPGEMAIFTKGKKDFRRMQYTKPQERPCVFEWIYFSNPRSTYNGVYHEDFRTECGWEIGEENPRLKADIVVTILDSGKHAARGLAKRLGIEYLEAFQRTHNPPRANKRSFTSSTSEERIRTAYIKIHLRKDMVDGKHVITVDDSIVRGNTLRVLNERLKNYGARKITNCIASPPITNICPNGMDFQTTDQLAMVRSGSIEGVRDLVGADNLIYISIHGLNNVVSRTYASAICDGCFSNNYPIHPLKNLH